MQICGAASHESLELWIICQKKVSSFHDSSENESDVSCYLWITRVIEAEAIDWIKATETMVMVINTGDVSKATLVEGLITFDIA